MEITPTFYADAQKFVLNRIHAINPYVSIDKIDVLHSIIADKNVTDNNWKSLIDSYIYQESAATRTYSLDKLPSKLKVESRYCRHCDDSYPEQYFISGFNSKTQCYQYRTLCRACYRKTASYKEQVQKWRVKNKEKILVYQREYRKTHTDNTANERYLRWKLKHKTAK